MLFPDYRPRRMRRNEALRSMVRETTLSVNDFILPLFAIDGKGVKNPIDAMPGNYQLSVDNLVKVAKQALTWGFPASFFSASRQPKTLWEPRPTPKTASSSGPSRP
jgi:porphobilinogen synthase